MKNEKLDKTIKNKLEERRIEPSVSAWEKLSAQLEHREKRNQKPYLWTGIAAIFVIGFFVGGFVFMQFESHPESIKIVGNSEDKTQPEDKIEIENPFLPEEKQAEEIILVESEGSKNPISKKPANKLDGLMEESLNSPDNKTKNEEESLAINPIEDSMFLQEEAEKILLKIIEKPLLDDPATFASISDAEVEELLREARAEINQKPYFVWEDNHVDAQALLESVESELDPSYKEKLFRFVESKLIQLASASRVVNP